MASSLTNTSHKATPHSRTLADDARTSLWPLGALLVSGLIVRLVLLWQFQGVGLAVFDENDYNRLAINLVEHGEYAFHAGTPTSLRPPLYPAVVSLIYAVAGQENYQGVRAFQIVLSLATVVVVYALGRNQYSHRVGMLAAGLFCFYPSLLGASNLVLTETLFTLLLCLFVLAMQLYFSQGSWKWLVAAGMLLGLSALTRSVVWLFPPFAVIAILFFSREPVWKVRLVACALFVAMFCVTLAPWTIRNTLVQRTFTTVDVMGGRNVMMGNYEFTPRYRPWAAVEIQGERAWHSVLREEHGGFQDKTQGQIDKLALKHAISYVLEHPGQSIQRSAYKLLHFWQLERELIAGMQQGLWGTVSKGVLLALAAVILGFYTCTMVAAIYGAWMAPPKIPGQHVLILLLVGFVTALHCVAFAHSRYHLPLMPLLMLYAAAAWDGRGAWLAHWKSWRFAAASALVLVLATSWVVDLAFEASRF